MIMIKKLSEVLCNVELESNKAHKPTKSKTTIFPQYCELQKWDSLYDCNLG